MKTNLERRSESAGALWRIGLLGAALCAAVALVLGLGVALGYMWSQRADEDTRDRFVAAGTKQDSNVDGPRPWAGNGQAKREGRERLHGPSRARFEKVLAHLREEGFRPHVDDDGDINFKVEGGTFLIVLSEDDPTYYRVCFPNFWEIKGDEERQRVLMAASHATARCKGAKVFIVRDNTWAIIESFYSNVDDFLRMFGRNLGAVQAAASIFREQMQ